MYGVFYKDGKKWRGPVETLTSYNKKQRRWAKLLAGKKLKKKIKLLKQIWKS